jgi:plasmid maintenance system antidote protein VapI
MKAEGLTNSKFASKLGVQRSNITHIIDKRNKPSISFIEKIIAKFPHVNIEWLITGTGEMYKQNEISVQESKQKTEHENVIPPTLFPEITTLQTTDHLSKSNHSVPQNVQEIKEMTKVTNVSELKPETKAEPELEHKQELKLEFSKPESTTETTEMTGIKEKEETNTKTNSEMETKTEIKTKGETQSEITKEKETEIKAETKTKTPSSQNTGSNENIENEKEIECVLIFHSDKTFKYYRPG